MYKGFKNARVLLRHRGVVETSVAFDGDRIVKIGGDPDGIEELFPAGGIIVPGFIDEHIHGAGGADAMDGTPEALSTISEYLAREGTTSFLATTMTQGPENITRALENVRSAMEKGVFPGARVLGVHLEGPFIAAKHAGAQPHEYIVHPDVDAFHAYQKAAGGHIRIVTLAPEEEGGEALIACLAKEGVVASIGHTSATYEQVLRAVLAGASNVTHTYNAQSGLHHREAGVVGAAMLLDELNCEMICDTIHVSVPAIRLVRKNKPADKFTLITDAMRAKGLPDGVSELGGQTVYVKGGEARLADGTLAGSVLRMNAALRNLVEKVGVAFADAVDCCTYNPARNLGLSEDIGSIAVGHRADVTVLSDDFSVIGTVVGGKTVYHI